MKKKHKSDKILNQIAPFFAIFFFACIIVGYLLVRASELRTKIGLAPALPVPTTIPLVNAMEVFDLVNDERERAGLTPLVWSSALGISATQKAEDMCQKQYWQHDSPDGIKPWKFITEQGGVYEYAGENLAKDFWQAQDVVRSWMESASHKENIVNKSYKETGIGIIRCDFEGIETQLIVQHFATFSDFPISGNRETGVGSSSTVNPNDPVHCPVHADCGGGTIPLKRWECEQSTCCEMNDGSWEFYTSLERCQIDQQKG